MTSRKNVLGFILLALLGCCCFASAQERRSAPSVVSRESLDEMMVNAAVAELDKKTVEVEDLVVGAGLYFGKVVKVKYKGIRFLSRGGMGSSYLYIYGDNISCRLRLFLPNDREALEWAVDEGKRADVVYYDDVPGSAGSLYVYVGDDTFLAMGRRIRKIKDGMTYSW
jgi:hypothetical protein